MALTEKTHYVLYDKARMQDTKQPMKLFYVHLVATKNFVFIFPERSQGVYILLEVDSQYDIFNGQPVGEALRQIISTSSTVEELEKSLSAALGNHEKFVHDMRTKTLFRFGSFLGKHTMTMSYGSGSGRMSLLVLGKSKQFRDFLGK